MFSLLRKVSRKSKSGSKEKKPTRRFLPELVELETRALLSIVLPGTYTPDPTLIYHGGPLINNPGVETVYYPGYDPTLRSGLDGFFANIVNSDYLTQLLADYSVANYPIGAGSFLGEDIVSTQPTPQAGSSLSDAAIQGMLKSELAAGRIPDPTTSLSKLYVVYTPPGVEVTTVSGSSEGGFLGYHKSLTVNGETLAYAVLPYEGSVNGVDNLELGVQAEANLGLSANPFTEFQELTAATSHEFTEAITDTTNAWWDSYDPIGGLYPGGFEGADLAHAQLATYHGYLMQEIPSIVEDGPTSQPIGTITTGADANFFVNEVNNPTTGNFNGVVATFTDKGGGLAINFSATVNWSDGTESSTTDGKYDLLIFANGDGTYRIVGKHTYVEPVGTRFGSNGFNLDGLQVFVTDNKGEDAWVNSPVTLVAAQTADVTAIASSSASGTYAPHSTITLTVDFSEAVNVTGTPTLSLTSGGTATYVSGSGTPELTFSYSVVYGQTTNGANLDVSSPSALSGTITDTSGNPANVILPVTTNPAALPSFKSLLVSDTIDHFALVPTVSSAVAGSAFSLLIIAQDANNNTVNYTGRINLVSNDPLVPSEGSASFYSGSAAATIILETASTTGWTITGSENGISSTTIAIPVTPAPTSQLVISGLPASGVTGTPLSPTVSAEDAYGNVTPNYTGTVWFSSTDPRISAGNNLPANYTFTSGPGDDNGVHTFTNGVTIVTPGPEQITVADTSSGAMAASSSVTTIGLRVMSITGNATGFTVTFNKPFDPATLNLYATTPSNPDLLFYMTNTQVGPSQLTGSVVPNATDTAFTFVETFFADENGALPNGVYDVSLLSSSSGLKDVNGVPLDASNSPNTSPNLYSTLLGQSAPAYSNSFTLATISALTDTSQNTPTQVAVSLPAFAQGPGLPVNVQVHNSLGAGGTYPGIPATVSDGNNASTVSFSVTYNTALLTVTGGIVDPSIVGSYPQATFTRTATGVPVGNMETDTFTFSTGDGSLLSTGSAWTLGDITASVPNVPGQQIYKSKQLLTVSNVSSDGAVTNLVGGNGFEVVDYLGDASGDGNIQLNDATLVNSAGNPLFGGGFPAFTKVDPVVLADADGAGFVDSSTIGNIALLATGHAQATIPVPPVGRITSAGGPDPDLSLPSQVTPSHPPFARGGAGGLVEVPVNLDNAMPAGSTGLTEATLDLTYDPHLLTVSAADVHLGTLPALGSGWTISSVVNQASGQLVIQLYSLTPLTVSAAGSLVIVDFHVLPGAEGAGSVSLVDWANPTGQAWFRTSLSDTNGSWTLGIPDMSSIFVLR